MSQLGISGDGRLLAWVRGETRYAVCVRFDEGELFSDCTCPYDFGPACKHAVAALLEYLQQLKRRRTVGLVADDDERWALLADKDEAPQTADWEVETWEENHEVEDYDADSKDFIAPSSSLSRRSFLEGHSQKELIRLIERLAEIHPAVASDLDHRLGMASQSVERLKRQAMRAIQEAGAPSWEDRGWGGSFPGYDRVHDYLRRLLALGHADAVVDLGDELLESGRLVVEQVRDEGEIGMEIAACMKTVFKALHKSSLSTSDQMLWMIKRELDDDYELLCESDEFWSREFDPSEWRIVADSLKKEVERRTPEGRDYRRDVRVNRLISALESAGLDHEILPLCRREAELTHSYERLVERLLQTGEFDEARQWIQKGVLVSQETYPGIARQLRERLIEILEKESQYPSIASLRAQDFFSDPSLHAYQSLAKAAARAEAWPQVREAALRFLETGEKPVESGSADVAPSAWPLPRPEAPPASDAAPRRKPPFVSVLIDVAIAEKRPDDVLLWYDRQIQERGKWRTSEQDLRVAAAIAERHPDRAVRIWSEEAEREISRTDPRCYEVAADHLSRIRKVLEKAGETERWEACLSDIRARHRRKRRLMEILDGLDGTAIIDGLK